MSKKRKCYLCGKQTDVVELNQNDYDMCEPCFEQFKTNNADIFDREEEGVYVEDESEEEDEDN